MSIFPASEVSAQEPGASGILEEITVTARRREEGLQETPVSISAFTASDLAARQIDNISQISDATPNLIFDATTPISGSNVASSIYIRGVGQFDFTLVSDPGVGMYVDGVYVARSVGGVLDILDVERVEVLRGPQGTLFGKNTIGGAINIISKRPADELGGYLEVKTGTDSRIDVKGSVDIPVSDTLGVKLSLADLNQDGYVKNLGGGDDLSDTNATIGRALVDWQPTDKFSALLAFDVTRRREQGRAQKLLSFNPAAGAPTFGPIGAVIGGPFPVSALSGGPFATNQGPGDEVLSDLDLWAGSLALEYEMENMTIKSITGYRQYNSEFGRDTDNSPFVVVHTFDDMDHEQFSQEIQIFGTAMDKRLDWLLGGFYFEEEGANRNDVDIPVFTVSSGGEIDNDSWAIFGQATYDVSDQLALTFGARYTDESKGFLPVQSVVYNATSPFFFAAGTNEVQVTPPGVPVATLPNGTPLLPSTPVVRNFDSFDVSGAINYQWNDDLMTYFSYSEGFKSGGIDQRVFPPRLVAATYEPETVTQYEVGAKWENASSTLRINGALFYSDYEDIQVRVLDVVAPGIGNAATGEILGAELELFAVPTKRLTITAGLAYLDTEIKELGADINPAPDADRIMAGNRFINSPEWSTNASVAYVFPVGSGLELTLRGDWSWKDTIYNNWANDDIIAQPDFHLFNASASLDFINTGWEMVLAGRNLGDKTYIVTGNHEFAGFGYIEAVYAREREWSLSLKYSF